MFDKFKADCIKAWGELLGYFNAIQSPLARVGVVVGLALFALFLVVAVAPWLLIVIPLGLLLLGLYAVAQKDKNP